MMGRRMSLVSDLTMAVNEEAILSRVQVSKMVSKRLDLYTKKHFYGVLTSNQEQLPTRYPGI